MTCKWLVTIVSPLSRVVPLPNGLNGLYMGVTNHLLTGMILQALPFHPLLYPFSFNSPIPQKAKHHLPTIDFQGALAVSFFGQSR